MPMIRDVKEQQVREASVKCRVAQMDRAEKRATRWDPAQREVERQIRAAGPVRNADVKCRKRPQVSVQNLSKRADVRADSISDPVLTIREVSRRFSVCTKTVDRWRKRGLADPRMWF